MRSRTYNIVIDVSEDPAEYRYHVTLLHKDAPKEGKEIGGSDYLTRILRETIKQIQEQEVIETNCPLQRSGWEELLSCKDTTPKTTSYSEIVSSMSYYGHKLKDDK